MENILTLLVFLALFVGVHAWCLRTIYRLTRRRGVGWALLFGYFYVAVPSMLPLFARGSGLLYGHQGLSLVLAIAAIVLAIRRGPLPRQHT